MQGGGAEWVHGVGAGCMEWVLGAEWVHRVDAGCMDRVLGAERGRWVQVVKWVQGRSAGCREVVLGAGRGAGELQHPGVPPGGVSPDMPVPAAAPRSPTRWCWASTTWVLPRAPSSASVWPPPTSSSTPNGEATAWPAGEPGARGAAGRGGAGVSGDTVPNCPPHPVRRVPAAATTSP